MIRLIIRKTGILILVFIGITLISFYLTYLSPSDPAEIKLNKTGVAPTSEMLELAREEMGLNRPMLIQYRDWLGDIFKGDLGNSLRNGNTVSSELEKALPNTISLTVFAMIMVMIFSIPIGVLCAKYKDQAFDNMIRFVTFLFASIPSFFLALLFLYFFCVKLGWLTVISQNNLKGLLMPSLVLAISLSAWFIRQVRTIVLEEMAKEYVLGARARGVTERSILFRHVLCNSLLPIFTLVGLTFAGLLGGATIVENIFSWPGVGKLALEAISARDYPVIQGYVLWMATIFLFVNFIVDLSYSWIDPRIRKQSGDSRL